MTLTNKMIAEKRLPMSSGTSVHSVSSPLNISSPLNLTTGYTTPVSNSAGSSMQPPSPDYTPDNLTPETGKASDDVAQTKDTVGDDDIEAPDLDKTPATTKVRRSTRVSSRSKIPRKKNRYKDRLNIDEDDEDEADDNASVVNDDDDDDAEEVGQSGKNC